MDVQINTFYSLYVLEIQKIIYCRNVSFCLYWNWPYPLSSINSQINIVLLACFYKPSIVFFCDFIYSQYNLFVYTEEHFTSLLSFLLQYLKIDRKFWIIKIDLSFLLQYLWIDRIIKIDHVTVFSSSKTLVPLTNLSFHNKYNLVLGLWF